MKIKAPIKNSFSANLQNTADLIHQLVYAERFFDKPLGA
jgi:hypothetical protein